MKKKKRKLPAIPIQNIPRNVDGIIGNYKAKTTILNFLRSNDFHALIVWGAPGVGKSSYCHLLFRQMGIWAHTINSLFDYVFVDGKPPKISQSIKRILNRRLPQQEIFFLDHIVSVCQNDPDEIERIIKCIFSEKFQNSGKKIIIGIDNLYSRECAPFRKLLNPYKVTKKKKVIIGTQVRFWPLNEKDIEIILRQQGLLKKQDIVCGIQTSKGDGRQAILYAEMVKKKIISTSQTSATSGRDTIINPFDATRLAFEGKKKSAKGGCEWYLMRQMIFHNYPFNLIEEKSIWDNNSEIKAITKKISNRTKISDEEKQTIQATVEKDRKTLKELSLLSEHLSDSLMLKDSYAEEMMLSSCAVSPKTKAISKWPDTLYHEKVVSEMKREFRPICNLLRVNEEDLGTVTDLLTKKIEDGDQKLMNWMYTHKISQNIVCQRAQSFF